MIVIDASAVVHMLIGAGGMVIGLSDESEEMHAPVSVDAEVLHALRRLWVAKVIPAERAEWAVIAFQDMPITRHTVQPLVLRMWELRDNVTAYDAAYIALAENLNAPLVTRDARLARSSGHAAVVELIE